MKSKSNKLITSRDIGKIYECYNGKNWNMILIIEDMIDHYLGEFIITKKLGMGIHKINKKKKKINNRK